jgi:hypothetical protein
MNMKKALNALKNKLYYSVESIRNRYPCKIIKIQNELAIKEKSLVSFQAVTKLNIQRLPLNELIEDAMLVEKFHPTDCIKLGFLSAGDILLKNTESLSEARKKYNSILQKMFHDKEDE